MFYIFIFPPLFSWTMFIFKDLYNLFCLLDIWVDSSLGVLWIKLQHTLVYKSLCGYKFSCLLNALLGPVVSVNFSVSFPALNSTLGPWVGWGMHSVKSENTPKSHQELVSVSKVDPLLVSVCFLTEFRELPCSWVVYRQPRFWAVFIVRCLNISSSVAILLTGFPP